MSYELTIMPGTQIALFCWSGPITPEDRKRNIKCIAQFCSENGISQVIYDARQQVNKTSMMQMFNIGTTVPKAFRGIQIAVVRHPSDKETKFYEDVVANRGADSRSFVTLEEAQSWLSR